MKPFFRVERVLDMLEGLHRSWGRDDADPLLIEETGYGACHCARLATEMLFRKLHDVEDICPALADERIYGRNIRQARGYLRAGLASAEENAPREKAMRAVAELIRALKEPENSFRVATAANEVAIILLGPNRLGGVYAEWQASTLGVGLFTWIEQQSLNLRVHGLAEQLDKALAQRDAERFALPGLDFIHMGSYGNIAKACFRAVAEDACAGFSARNVAARGSEALQEIERGAVINPAYRKYVLEMMAMSSVIGEHFGGRNTFWTDLTADETSIILRDIERTEPSRELRKWVRDSARRTGRN